jgi:hypothetical protein
MDKTPKELVRQAITQACEALSKRDIDGDSRVREAAKLLRSGLWAFSDWRVFPGANLREQIELLDLLIVVAAVCASQPFGDDHSNRRLFAAAVKYRLSLKDE